MTEIQGLRAEVQRLADEMAELTGQNWQLARNLQKRIEALETVVYKLDTDRPPDAGLLEGIQ